MIEIKTTKEIAIMQEGGKRLARTLNTLIANLQVGLSTKALDDLAESMLKKEGGKPSFKGYQGFPGTICTSVNSGLVHGVPSDYRLQKGDVLSIDIGFLFENRHTDMARMVIVSDSDKTDHAKEHFLQVGSIALQKAISTAKVGRYTGDISAAMQQTIEGAGFSVSRTFTGHGIGRRLHEEPSIFCFGEKGEGKLLKENMVLAIEVIYAEGSAESVIDTDDGWTVTTQDGSLGGLFEHTVAITNKGPLVLTKA